MRLYEGNILTCDKENRIAHYLLEDQGKILYCGDELRPAVWRRSACPPGRGH